MKKTKTFRGIMAAALAIAMLFAFMPFAFAKGIKAKSIAICLSLLRRKTADLF